IPARTPANTAMTAMTLDAMSGGRFLLGLGGSGPQGVEGWHGQPWGKPLAQTRACVESVRTILRRGTPGPHGPPYHIPSGRTRPGPAAEGARPPAPRRPPDLPRGARTEERRARRRDRRRLAADLPLARALRRRLPAAPRARRRRLRDRGGRGDRRRRRRPG